MKTNDMYEELSKEWKMTSEEIQNAIYKEWHKKYHQAASRKLQAPSLTGPVGDDRMNLERNNYEYK